MVMLETRLEQAGAQSDALKELVEGERGQQGADGAGGVADAQRDPNQHGVERDARLQHLRAHALLDCGILATAPGHSLLQKLSR